MRNAPWLAKRFTMVVSCWAVGCRNRYGVVKFWCLSYLSSVNSSLTLLFLLTCFHPWFQGPSFPPHSMNPPLPSLFRYTWKRKKKKKKKSLSRSGESRGCSKRPLSRNRSDCRCWNSNQRRQMLQHRFHAFLNPLSVAPQMSAMFQWCQGGVKRQTH